MIIIIIIIRTIKEIEKPNKSVSLLNLTHHSTGNLFINWCI